MIGMVTFWVGVAFGRHLSDLHTKFEQNWALFFHLYNSSTMDAIYVRSFPSLEILQGFFSSDVHKTRK